MLVKRFRGRIVKRMRRVEGGILLTFLSTTPGQSGGQLLVSQAEWDRHGSASYEPGRKLADLRRRQRPE